MPQLEFDPTGIDVVGFDLDNTLYPVTPEMNDEIQGYIYTHIADELGVDVETAKSLFHHHYKHGHGLSGGASLRALGVSSEGVVQRALEEADIAQYLTPDHETLQLLDDLQRRYRSVDLLTGSDRSQTMRKLGALAIPPEVFGVIITGDMAEKGNGDAFRMWLERYDRLRPEQFVNVGDRPQLDHTAPMRLGIRSILVNMKVVDPAITCPQLPTLHEVRGILLPKAA
jgi:FMN phosphatase YigB (HAD superfamily)